MLCVIVHKAKIKGIKRVTPDNSKPEAQELRKEMQLGKDALNKNTGVCEMTMRELIKKMGMPWAGRRSIQMIRDAMRRMSLIGFRIRNLDDNKNVISEEVFTLISFIKNKITNGRDGKLQIHLNVALVRMIKEPKNFTKRAVKPRPLGRGYKAHLNWNFCL